VMAPKRRVMPYPPMAQLRVLVESVSLHCGGFTFPPEGGWRIIRCSGWFGAIPRVPDMHSAADSMPLLAQVFLRCVCTSHVMHASRCSALLSDTVGMASSGGPSLLPTRLIPGTVVSIYFLSFSLLFSFMCLSLPHLFVPLPKRTFAARPRVVLEPTTGN